MLDETYDEQDERDGEARSEVRRPDEALVTGAECLASLGHYAEARVQLDAALKLNPENAKARALSAAIHEAEIAPLIGEAATAFLNHELERSEELLGRIQAIDPNHQQAAQILASIEERKRSGSKAGTFGAPTASAPPRSANPASARAPELAPASDRRPETTPSPDRSSLESPPPDPATTRPVPSPDTTPAPPRSADDSEARNHVVPMAILALGVLLLAILFWPDSPDATPESGPSDGSVAADARLGEGVEAATGLETALRDKGAEPADERSANSATEPGAAQLLPTSPPSVAGEEEGTATTEGVLAEKAALATDEVSEEAATEPPIGDEPIPATPVPTDVAVGEVADSQTERIIEQIDEIVPPESPGELAGGFESGTAQQRFDRARTALAAGDWERALEHARAIEDLAPGAGLAKEIGSQILADAVSKASSARLAALAAGAVEGRTRYFDDAVGLLQIGMQNADSSVYTAARSYYVAAGLFDRSADAAQGDGIGSALSRYAEAHLASEIESLRDVWPEIGGDELATARRLFRTGNGKFLEVTLEGCQTHLGNGIAVVECNVREIYQPRFGPQRTSSQAMTFHLRSTDDGWVIERRELG